MEGERRNGRDRCAEAVNSEKLYVLSIFILRERDYTDREKIMVISSENEERERVMVLKSQQKKLSFDKELFKRSVLYNVKTLYRKTMEEATPQQIFQAVSYAIKDAVVDYWMETQKEYDKQDPKMVYYMSMEFLMGRALGNNIINLQAYVTVQEALEELESTGYTDDISVEVTNSIYYEAPDAATEKILQFLRGLKMFK